MDTIQLLYSIIGTPLGYILYFIYNFIIDNVGIAILLFTFIIKLAMLPLAIKQQKSTAKSAIFAPRVKEIQTKYRNNQEKQQQELAKLQQEGYNPMGGCGVMLLTFLLLFGVLDVVYKPMTHIVHVPSDKVSEMVEEAYEVEFTAVFVKEVSRTDEELTDMKAEAVTKHDEILRDAKQIIEYYNANCLADGEQPKDISVFNTVSKESRKVIDGFIRTAITEAHETNEKYTALSDADIYKLTDEESKALNAISDSTEKAEYKASHCFSSSTNSALTTVQSHFGAYKMVKGNDGYSLAFEPTKALQRELYALETFGTVDERMGVFKNAFSERVVSESLNKELTNLYDNLNFLGIPLGQVPSEHMGFPLILVPIISFLMALIQTFISNKMMEQNNPDAASSMGASMKITMYIMPVFSLFLAFTIPAGAGFYWTISYVFGIFQTIILNKLYSPAKLKAQAEAEYAEQQKRRKEQAAAEAAALDESALKEYNGEKLTQKEINRRKLAEARKADALKYGEEYHDDDE